ncbi:radical SAM protein [Catenulispora pinisilvae]|uniref:radical SAM protein n=1 Tax=Catenulispora pinisilvae TaxID=2705253 RepID=UPI001892494D|nr:radical SAM protein [Catenulispora pinisilvae]
MTTELGSSTGTAMAAAVPVRMKHVFLRLLNTCNLECAHCYASCGPSAREALTLETVLRLVGELPELRPETVHLEGGEALMFRGFWELLDALNDHGISPAITSNGLAVTQKTIDRLKGRVSRLTFSIDGPTAFTHDKIRRRIGSFDKVTEAARMSVAAGIPTHMISVVWRETVRQVAQTVALAEELGVDRLLLFSCGVIGAAVQNEAELRVDPQTWVEYLWEVKELAVGRPWIWYELDRVPRENLPDFLPVDYQPVCTRRKRESIIIDPNGDVYPCGYFIPTGQSLGNVHNASLRELVQREQTGERFSGACRDPWSLETGMVELCKLVSINSETPTVGARP